jgi:hypothetical protein
MKIILSNAVFCISYILGSNFISAATTWNGGTSSNFGTAGNWSNNSPGNAADDGSNNLATINNGDTVVLSSDYTGTNTYKLAVGGNSTLNASANFTATGLTIQDTGVVNLTDGAFTLPKTSASNNGQGSKGTLNIQSGGILNISGGSHIFNERSTMNGTFRVTGSNASISMNQIGSGNGTFDFVFDAVGVSGVYGNLSFPWLSIGATSVTVDGSSYTGGVASFTLFDGHGAGNTPDASNFTISGLGDEGVGWTLDITNNPNGPLNDTVILNVIPEPSTTILLGLGGLALILRRKK